MTTFFGNIDKIKYEGPESSNPLAYKWYDENRMVLGKTMKEQLRMAVCYWHNFCWNGFDPFSHTGTLERPWFKIADPMDSAKAKADVAFEFFSKLGLPYYSFHDRDIAEQFGIDNHEDGTWIFTRDGGFYEETGVPDRRTQHGFVPK